MKILIVEDEQKTASYLRRGLTENGFTVEVAREGENGLQAALSNDYDLMILDVMLPRRDGWLFLTARDAIQHRVKGLELGADDYLVKPFAFSELLARLRSILRRTAPGTQDSLRIADLELDLIRHKATRRGKRLDLTPKEFALLSLLARRPAEVLSRTLIAEQVWDIAFASDTNVVDVHVRRLRSKVDDPFDHKLIHTVRGVGYVLEERP